MNWTNPNEFFAMGGYATYVWGSVGVTVLVLYAECLFLFKRRKTALLHVKRDAALRAEDSR